MASVVTLGLSEIKVGAGVKNGTAPTNLEKIGKTYQDSCKLVQEASEVTEHFEEGKSAPEIRKKRKKMPVLTFSIMDPDLSFLAKFIGGEITGSGANEEWGFDGSETVEDMYVQVIPEQGLQIDIPNGDIEAVVNAALSATGIFLIDFTVTPKAVDMGKAIKAKKIA